MATQLTAGERDVAHHSASRLREGNWQEWCDLDRAIDAIVMPEKKRAAERLRRLILELLPEEAQAKLFNTGWRLGEMDFAPSPTHLPRERRPAAIGRLNSQASL